MSDTDDRKRWWQEKIYEFCGYTLKISMFKDSSLGVSAYVWEPGIELCQHFQNVKMNFFGKRILELGSGTGIVGVLAVLLGGDVTLTDKPDVLKQIEHNVSANIPSHSRHRANIGTLVWGTDQDNYPSDFDIIIGSDIVYSPTQFPNLIKTLQHFCNENTIIYLSSNLEFRVGAVNFHEEILPKKFNSEIIYSNNGNCIYKITKKLPIDAN
ncbi:EEF1A lysine methyltransferase 3-like [Hypanus sabinus]|uniref:EEF1A lysine methyltransferase 3-like n=1 Tax=Hypanus sabinus TaxID=79690 RepID=UPI0028C380D0|nr:EEF1A lysine methyltransferase 3-like [Hypanus sabinus]